MHLDFYEPVALARLTAAALDVEREPAGSIAAQLGLREIREELPNRGEQPRIRRRIRARRAADGALIDVDDLIDVVETLQTVVSAGDDLRAIEVPCEGLIQDVDNQGRFSRS